VERQSKAKDGRFGLMAGRVTHIVFLLLIVFLSYPSPSFGETADGPRIAGSYAQVKRWLYDEVFADRRETLYCGCAYDQERRPDAASCGYVPRSDNERARRIEVEHVIPVSWIAQGRRCWSEPICTDGAGRAHKGRRCCEASDPAYRRAAWDLHNLWPVIGELNEQRGNYRFGIIPGEPRAYGQCDLEVDHAARIVEPRPEVRGDIARIAFYMEAVHGVWLSEHHRALFTIWNRSDPPDAFERERDRRIARLQGNHNPFVRDYERLLAEAGAD
jgi:deoxyribonuclease I